MCPYKIWSRFCNGHPWAILSVCPSVFWNRYKARSEPSKEIKFSKKHWNYIGFHLDSNLLCPCVCLSFESGTEHEGNKSWNHRKTMRIEKRSESENDENRKMSFICIIIHQKTYIMCPHKICSWFCNVHLSVCLSVRFFLNPYKARSEPSKETKFVKKTMKLYWVSFRQ